MFYYDIILFLLSQNGGRLVAKERLTDHWCRTHSLFPKTSNPRASYNTRKYLLNILASPNTNIYIGNAHNEILNGLLFPHPGSSYPQFLINK